MQNVSLPQVLGLDIGGANLKVAHVSGAVRSVPFAVWKNPEGLAGAIAESLAVMPPFEVLAVTMTAELCDCFETKRQGVEAVLDAVERATGRVGESASQRVSESASRRVGPGELSGSSTASSARGSPADCLVWQTSGRFVSVAEARRTPLEAAASNWMALAAFAGRSCPQGPALLIDIGSTTTDIVPLVDGVPAPIGRTDPDRLASGELVYSGVRRTPLCAVVREVPFRGRPCPVASEWFATTLDVYLMLEAIPENAEDRNTADGRPAIRRWARDRLARVICADREMLPEEHVLHIAQAVADAQLDQIGRALKQVVSNTKAVPRTIILSGEGEFLGWRLVEAVWGSRRKGPTAHVVSLAELRGAEISQAACAYAVAMLAAHEHAAGSGQWAVGSAASEVEFHQEIARPAPSPVVVVKIGGSLLDLPDLPSRLKAYSHTRAEESRIFVVGGGLTAQWIREMDARHGLGEEASHWLAIRAMSFNARLIEALLEDSRVVDGLEDCRSSWQEGLTPILDPWTMLREDGQSTASILPHSWAVTSDSIAAWVARRAAAQELVLLKSAPLPDRSSVAQAAERGLVDTCFAEVSRGVPRITYVNLREGDAGSPSAWRLR